MYPISRVQVAQRLAAERRVLREKTFKNVRYATEDDVRAFAAYSKVSPRAAGIFFVKPCLPAPCVHPL